MPTTYKINYLNDGVSYTNNVNRLVEVPFQLVEVNNDTEQVVTNQVTLTQLKSAFTENDINSGTTDSTNYPHKWTTINTSAPETATDVWTDTYIEYDSSSNIYRMHVPLGGTQTTEPEKININFSSDDTYDGDYALYTGTIPSGNYVLAGSTGYKSYKCTKNDKNYYLVAIKLFVTEESSGGGSGNNGYESDYYSSGTTVAKIYSQAKANSTEFLSWAIIEEGSGSTGTIKRVAIYGKFLSSANTSDYVPYTDLGMKFAECLNETPNSSTGLFSYFNYSKMNDSTSVPNPFSASSSGYSKSFSATVTGGSTSEASNSNTVYFQLLFKFNGNNTVYFTSASSTTLELNTSSPTAVNLSIIGSSGLEGYTGFYKKHGRFFPSKYVSVIFSAVSDIKMTYEISSANIESSVSGTLVSGVAQQCLVKLKSTGASWFTEPWTATIYLTVTNEAGTDFEIHKTIKVIPKLYRTAHLNLRDENTEYSHKVTYGTSDTILMEKRIDDQNFTRSWNEIWYPETHGSPLNADGTIDAVKATTVAKIPQGTTNQREQSDLIKYDKLALQAPSNTQLAVDSDGRYIQNTNMWSRTKKYPSRVNSRLVDNAYEKYWIIDNTGSPDFQLEFEIFDFSSSITKYPENLCARYSGDSLSVFDASADGCLYPNPVVDENGITHWQLKDSSKLVHLFSLKGSCFNKDTNPFTILDSELGGNISEGEGLGFTCPSITTCSKICIVPFTDYGDDDSSRGSGFKLKAGPKRSKEFQNYEYQNSTGEFWIHVSPSNSAEEWGSPNNVKITYSYYESSISVDSENGTVTFTSRPTYPVLATFTNYLYLYKDSSGYPHGYFSKYNSASTTNCLMTFVASQDDFVDYMNMSFYVSYQGADPIKSQTYNPNASSHDSSGRLLAYRIDGDTGILRCTTDTPPRGRLFADYYYHTFYRLTSDGYGDLYFYGSGILVPASSTNTYNDWTYVDLKIVNEGSNTIDSTMLTFLARGYITNGTVVDTVIDQNRPWDIQEGTTAETVNRTGARMRTSYATLNTDSECIATRANAFNARSSQTCSLGTIEPKGCVFVRVFWCIAANTDGTAWIDVSRGKKTYSAELSGTYFIFK